MKLLKVFSMFILLFFLMVPEADSQIVRFYPSADTVFIGGGCTIPILSADSQNTVLQDSIYIAPGWNTMMWIKDSLGTNQNIDSCYFLVNDSLDQFDYELWIKSLVPSGLPPIELPFDSSFTVFDTYVFNLQLLVKEQNVVIDSLSQIFKSVIGLGIDPADPLLRLPRQPQLSQSYPNPFNPETTIRFYLPRQISVSLDVFDPLGRKVRTLINGFLPAGFHRVKWDGRNDAGQIVASGMYICRLQSKDIALSKQMYLIR